MVPDNHGLSAGVISVEPGETETRGNVDISCPAGGSACSVTIADDGSVSYNASGGRPTIALTTESLTLPTNHGLTAGEITVQPGMSETHGNVNISCPVGDGACTLTIADDGSATYVIAGGQPTIMLATEAVTLPTNHGLAAGEITVQPGMSETHGNVNISCPAGANACMVTIADDGSATYIIAGGQPTIMLATEAVTLPTNHGLAAGEITVQPGMSETHGNVNISCPAGDNACTVTVDDDGSATYTIAGGQPTIMLATEAVTLPTNHGLAAGEITVQPGMSETHGNVNISCPAGDNACTVTVADDGSATYIIAGGQPTIMLATELVTLPTNHGLAAGEITVQPGMSETHGNVNISCPAGDNACTVTVADDGSATYIVAGGQPTIMLATESLELPANHGLAAGEITVQPGMSETHGNVNISCPEGDYPCTMTVTEDGMVAYNLNGGMPTVALLPVRLVKPGLSKSLSDPVYSNAENDIPFSQSISNSENTFAPITTALDRNSGETSTVTSSDAAIKSISSDGDGGYYVTFVVDDEEWTQHYSTEHYLPDLNSYGSKPEDNAPFSNGIWFETTGFTYFSVYGGESGSLDPNVEPRMYFIAGLKTEILPTTTARYVGKMTGQIWRNTNQSDQTPVRGLGILRANFEQSTINGEITKIRVRPKNAESFSSLEENEFIIETSNIENSQFVAILRGADGRSGLGDTSSNEDIESIEGFAGNILGEFYGPLANEVGAVLNATRGDAVLIGFLGGRSPFNPTGPIDEATSDPINASISRDLTQGSSNVQHSADTTRVDAITTTSGGGISLTYSVDGVQHTVEFEDGDLDFDSSYNKVSNNRSQKLWTNTNGFSTPDFKHLNSYYFESRESSDPQFPLSLFVNGLRTDADDLPTGRATYLGRAWIDSWKDCCLKFSDRESTKGSLSLTANFTNNTISGLIQDIESRRNSGSSFISVPNASADISNGTINGNQFNANLQGTGQLEHLSGEMSGAFYGPAAEEVGGVITTTSTNNSVGIGWFGGSRETD